MGLRHPKEMRIRALDLRREGWSYEAIARKLGISASTAYIWCQGGNIAA